MNRLTASALQILRVGRFATQLLRRIVDGIFSSAADRLGTPQISLRSALRYGRCNRTIDPQPLREREPSDTLVATDHARIRKGEPS